MENELKALVGTNEKILYEGKPDKKTFIFESVFNPMLPFALIWGIIDFGIIGFSIFGAAVDDRSFLYFIIPFMLLHLMPVWLYLGGVLLTRRKYKNTYYIVTDRAVYISSGTFRKNYFNKPFAELSHVDLHRGIFDQWFDVGDIIFSSSHFITRDSNGNQNISSASVGINSIKDYVNVYNLVKKLQQDIYTDVMYPNDKRPAENHGYNTEYKG